MAKQSSDTVASLASSVLKGKEPSRDEIESLAASVLAQSDGAEASADQASAIAAEPPVPGPDDVVTVTVSKTGVTRTVDVGAASLKQDGAD